MSTNELFISFISASEVLAAAIVLPCVGASSVFTRLWLRRRNGKSYGADDWLVLVALVFVVGMGAVQIYGVVKHALAYATPPYSSDTPMAQLTELSDAQRTVELVDWITWVLMIPANGLIKLSSLFLYRRLFVVSQEKVFGITTWALIGICTLWTVGFFFATIFGCGRHFTYPWGPLTQISSCNTNARLEALMISDLITDILVWVLPVPMIWKTQMNFGRKMAATGVLLLATISLAAAVVRLLVQEQITNGGYAAHTDVDQTLTILLYWSMIETGLALVASCLPTMRLHAALSSTISAVRSRSVYSKSQQPEPTPVNLMNRMNRGRQALSNTFGSVLSHSKSNSSQSLPLIELKASRKAGERTCSN